MMEKLQKNDHKGGWGHCDAEEILDRVEEELQELREAVVLGDPSKIYQEAADVANMAFMVADIKWKAHIKAAGHRYG